MSTAATSPCRPLPWYRKCLNWVWRALEGRRMEMNRLGELRKSRDLMKARLCSMEEELADLDRRLTKLEDPQHPFSEATFTAPIVANLHQAPARLQ
jgi:hypothetical protein